MVDILREIWGNLCGLDKDNNLVIAGTKIITNARGSQGEITITGPAKNVILDTDFWSDIDDVGSLRILTWAHRKGLINLMGVCVSTTQTTSAAAISAVLKADGVSCPVASGPLTSHTQGSNTYNATLSGFTKTIYSNTGLLDSVKLYRTLLARATSRVTLCIVGYLVNVQELLQSAPDTISPLSGAQLVAQKVEAIFFGGFDFTGATAEFNAAVTAQAKTATAYVLSNYQGLLYVNDYNTGLFPTFCNLTIAPTTSEIVAAAYSAASSAVGRRSWDPVTALLTVAPSLAAAGFAATSGRVTFDSSTGFASFTAGNSTHRNCVATVNFRALQVAIENIMTPALQPASFQTIVEPNFATTAPPVTGVTDASNLVAWYVPSDTNVSNGAAVAAWPDRLGRWPLVQATAGAQPTYASSKVSKNAVAFSADDALSAVGFAFPHPCTIYARVEIDSAPGATATILTNNHDTVASNNARSASFVMTTGRVPQMSVTGETTYAVDSAAAVATGGWVCLCGQMSQSTCEMSVDNVSDGTTALTRFSNYITGKLTVGGLFADGSISPFTGWLGEIRIYQGSHTSVTRALVIAEMAAGS